MRPFQPVLTSLPRRLRHRPLFSQPFAAIGSVYAPRRQFQSSGPRYNDDNQQLVPPPNLLVTLDAFGTIYEPRKPVAQLYVDVAAEHGLSGLNPSEVEASFKHAYARQKAEHPNYGKATGMKSSAWWEEVTASTFIPLLSPDQHLSPALHDALWTTFATPAGYALIPGTVTFLDRLHALRRVAAAPHGWKFRSITLGVVSNSDERVIPTLVSLGLPVRYRTVLSAQDGVVGVEALPSHYHDDFPEAHVVDFVTTSRDVGFEKPDGNIFKAAVITAQELMVGRDGEAAAARWGWIHIGDDKVEDVVGSEAAGAVPVLFDRRKKEGETRRQVMRPESGLSFVSVVGDLSEIPGKLDSIFGEVD